MSETLRVRIFVSSTAITRIYSESPMVAVFRFTTRMKRSSSPVFSSTSITPELDLSSFDTSNVLDFRMAFYLCKAKRINITSFVINKKADTEGMLGSFDGIIKHRGNVKEQLEER